MRLIIPAVMLILVSIVFFDRCDLSEHENQTETTIQTDSIPVPDPIIKYGIVVDSFIIDTGRVQPNQGLSHVLPPFGITQATIYKLANEFDGVFDVKKLKPNHFFTVLSTMNDTVKEAQYFIYEINAIEYLVYTFGDTLSAHIGSKPIDVIENQSGGVITSSLWNAFVNNGQSPALVMEVAKLYAWSIDFFRLKDGDFYKIIYDAKYVEGEFVGLGDIKAILFNHHEKEYYFFKYATDSTHGFYTEKGEQMERALLKAPLDFVRISSKFSYARKHPILGIVRPHLGVDYAAPSGTPVVATGDGTVTYAGYSGGAGKMIKIQHTTGGIETKYLHLSKFGPGVKKGAHVIQGQLIGEVGSTGMSTGPHLDYRVVINGEPVDPLGIEIPSTEPLKDSALVEYTNFIAPLKSRLDSVPVEVPVPLQQNDSIQ